jgi:biopolymer transport protein TolQ
MDAARLIRRRNEGIGGLVRRDAALIQDSGPALTDTGLFHLILGASVETQIVLGICAIFSVASWYVIAAKWWEFRGLASQRKTFHDAIDRMRDSDERLLAVGALGNSPYADVVRGTGQFINDLTSVMQRANVTRSGLSLTQLEALTLTVEAGISATIDETRRMIPLLAVVGATAPLLGLFGTVIGIMNAFLGIASKGSGNIAAVAPGIAEALIATAAGLGAAIPAVIAYNVFTGRSERFEGELERLAQETIGALGREGRL